MWSKQNPSYDYAKPLLYSLILHSVLLIIFYLSPHSPSPTLAPSVRVSLVQPQTFSPHQYPVAKAISEPIKPHTTSPAKAQPDVVKTTNISSQDKHQTSIEPILNTQAETPPNITTDTTKPIDSANLQQSKQDIVKTDNTSVTNDIEEPIFDAAYLQNPKPNYPTFAKRLQQQGLVKLRVKVSSEGIAEEIELSESSGFKLLDEAAQKTVKKWRFVPAKRGEQTISSWVNIPIRFKLD